MHDETRDRFAATRGTAARDVLPARARLLEPMGTFAGKWLHSVDFQPADDGGPLEQALIGTDLGDAGARSVAIQHVVRSFDPWIVCTAHGVVSRAGAETSLSPQIELFPLFSVAARARTAI